VREKERVRERGRERERERERETETERETEREGRGGERGSERASAREDLVKMLALGRDLAAERRAVVRRRRVAVHLPGPRGKGLFDVRRLGADPPLSGGKGGRGGSGGEGLSGARSTGAGRPFSGGVAPRTRRDRASRRGSG